MANPLNAYLRLAVKEPSYAAMLTGPKYNTWESLFALAKTCKSTREQVDALKKMMPLVGAIIKNSVYFDHFIAQITLYNCRNVVVKFSEGFDPELPFKAARTESIHTILLETPLDLTPFIKEANASEWLKLVRGDYRVMFHDEFFRPSLQFRPIRDAIFLAVKKQVEFREIKNQFREELMDRKLRMEAEEGQLYGKHGYGDFFDPNEPSDDDEASLQM